MAKAHFLLLFRKGIIKLSKDGKTALMAAAKRLDAEMIQVLLKNGANVLQEDKRAHTAISYLILVCNKRHLNGWDREVVMTECMICLEVILKNLRSEWYATVSNPATVSCRLAILLAISSNYPNILRILLENKIGLVGFTHRGQNDISLNAPPLMINSTVSETASETVIETTNEIETASWNSTLPEEYTLNFLKLIFADHPLHTASKGNMHQIIEILLEYKEFDVNATADTGKTPLFMCAQMNHVLAARLLLAKGASIVQTTCSGKTPLFVAVQNGHKSMIRELLHHVMDSEILTRKFGNNESAINLAIRRGHPGIVRDMLSCYVRHMSNFTYSDNLNESPADPQLNQLCRRYKIPLPVMKIEKEIPDLNKKRDKTEIPNLDKKNDKNLMRHDRKIITKNKINSEMSYHIRKDVPIFMSKKVKNINYRQNAEIMMRYVPILINGTKNNEDMYD
eukprot:GHVL01022321.1.p1 GENE.GHVL01022321.1~~GHVL01022321.1.p1  ORF type:complete len:453 (+),score=83.60 GHVL01022321.1:465-1823(+)